MQKSKFDLFIESKTKTNALKNLKGGQGGRTVFCKDGDGNVLGYYETDCDDDSYFLSDCKGLYPDTQYAVSW